MKVSTTIYLEDGVRKQIKYICIDRGIRMTDFVEEALREKVEAYVRERDRKKNRKADKE